MNAAILKATGRVQRVGFRRFVLEIAQGLGVVGYAKNEADGSVSIFAQAEKRILEEFLKKVRNPPPPASVKEIRESGVRLKPKLRNFTIRFGSVQEELQEGFASVQIEFQDYRQEFRDYREEFRDYREEFRDYRHEFRDYREEFRGFAKRTDENFTDLEAKYGEISEKLTSIMNGLAEESRKTTEMLEVMKSESKQTGEMLAESLRLLREAVEGMRKQG